MSIVAVCLYAVGCGPCRTTPGNQGCACTTAHTGCHVGGYAGSWRGREVQFREMGDEREEDRGGERKRQEREVQFILRFSKQVLQSALQEW